MCKFNSPEYASTKVNGVRLGKETWIFSETKMASRQTKNVPKSIQIRAQTKEKYASIDSKKGRNHKALSHLIDSIFTNKTWNNFILNIKSVGRR